MSLEILDALPDPVVRLDRSCRYLWVNRATARIAGRPAGAFVGSVHGEGDPGAVEARAVVRDVVERCFETGEMDTVRVRYRREDGDRWYESHVVPERDAAGRVEAVLMIGRDISHLKRVEHALGERVKELGCLQVASRALERAGDDVERALRQVCEAMPSGWQHPELACARVVVDALDVRTSGFEETPHALRAEVRIEGERAGFLQLCYLEPREFLDEEHELIESLAARIGDALHRVRADRALAASREYFRSLIEATTDMICIVGPEGRVRYASPACAALVGSSVQELTGTETLQRVHPDDREAVAAELSCVVRDPGHIGRVEYRLQHADGTYRTVETTGRNRLDHPSVQGIVTSTRDLSDRRELEQQLRQAQKMEAVGRLAGGIAHDFNNVLTIIDASAHLLAEELSEHDPRRQDVAEIRQAAQRAAGLTRRLLAFSRNQVMQPRLLELSTVVRDVEKLLRRLVGEDVELTTSLDPSTEWVRADPGQIEQVILNLVVNAREAMPRGGRLAIAVGGTVRADGTRARYVEVRDTGVGMDEAVRERIFDPFFTTKETGTGLGLATVYGIVQQSGGAIEVRSELGRGSSFRVVLPVVGSGALPRHPSRGRAEVASAAGRETVLLVEDEGAVRLVARRILERRGYRVITAEHGVEALRIARDLDTQLDLLLVDVVMPGMSGREVAEAVRELRPGLRVLYTSGYMDDAILQHGIRQAAVRLLSKPFTPDTLAAAVRDALDDAA